MALHHEAQIVVLFLETKKYLTRLSAVYARMERLPATDMEGLRKLARSASLNASDLSIALSELADVAEELRCEEADSKLDAMRPFSLINFNAGAGA